MEIIKPAPSRPNPCRISKNCPHKPSRQAPSLRSLRCAVGRPVHVEATAHVEDVAARELAGDREGQRPGCRPVCLSVGPHDEVGSLRAREGDRLAAAEGGRLARASVSPRAPPVGPVGRPGRISFGAAAMTSPRAVAPTAVPVPELVVGLVLADAVDANAG